MMDFAINSITNAVKIRELYRIVTLTIWLTPADRRVGIDLTLS